VAAQQTRFVEAVIPKVGHAQDTLVHAATAASLARYRLAHGHYPDSLGELVPSLLPEVPHGVFDGLPVRYTRSPEGGYTLTSMALEGGDKTSVWVQAEKSSETK
jgi:hypothetical protein